MGMSTLNFMEMHLSTIMAGLLLQWAFVCTQESMRMLIYAPMQVSKRSSTPQQ